MTVENRLVCKPTKAGGEVVHANEKGDWSEEKENRELASYSVNEEQTITEPENDGELQLPNKAKSGFVPVATQAAEPVPMPCPVSEKAAPLADASKIGSSDGAQELRPFAVEETCFIFDWDDTILPSAWVQSQGLRLDEESRVSESQRQQLSEAANAAAETLRIAKQHGTVVLVTNAERGWIELSCQKFLPTLYPTLENVKLLSARTTYESPTRSSPLDWKLCAFESEIRRVFGAEVVSEPERRKNILSLGDSVHEREALLRATACLPNCRSKSLKFVERPDIGQICKQHSLITGCFDRIVHHDGCLDLCIRCA